MHRIVAGLSAALVTVFLCASSHAAALAIPVFANGQASRAANAKRAFPA